MNLSIELDSELFLGTIKIKYVLSDALLTAEFSAVQF